MMYAYAKKKKKKKKKNKGADQPVYPRSMINAFLIPYLDCMMSLVSMINTKKFRAHGFNLYHSLD